MYKVVALYPTESGWDIWSQEFNTHEAATSCAQFLKSKVSRVEIIPDAPEDGDEGEE
jgi:hypothetical protein